MFQALIIEEYIQDTLCDFLLKFQIFVMKKKSEMEMEIQTSIITNMV